MKDIVLDTNLKSVNLFKKGKVRDIYDLDDKLLIVATDRAESSLPFPFSGLIFARTSLPTTFYRSGLPFSLSRKGSF